MLDRQEKVQSLGEYSNPFQSHESLNNLNKVQETMKGELETQENENISELKQFVNKNLNSRKKKVIALLVYVGLSALFLIVSFTLFSLAYKSYEDNNKAEFSHKFFNKKNSGLELGKVNFTIRNINQIGVNEEDILINSIIEGNNRIVYNSFLNQNKKFKPIDFDQLENYISQNIAHETFEFKFDQTLQKNWEERREELEITDEVKNNFVKLEEKKENYLQKIALQQINSGNQLPINIYQYEYLYADKKYNINKHQQQLPICILTYGSTVHPQDMKKYFNSLENLNYTNFHIVYINQADTQFMYSNAFTFLKQSELRVKNKFMMVNNLQDMGTLASLYFWGRRFCGDQDIVLVLGKNEEIIGRQALKIFNSVYSSPTLWYSAFKFMQKQVQKLVITEKNAASKLSAEHDQEMQNKMFHLRSFRKKLIDSVPIKSIMGLKYQRKTNEIWPVFYKSNLYQFTDYTQFHFIGIPRNLYIRQFLILANIHHKKCEEQSNQYFDKALELNSKVSYHELGKKAIINQNKIYNPYQMQQIKERQQKLVQCLIQNKNQNQNQVNDLEIAELLVPIIKKEIKIYKRTAFNQKYKDQPFGKSAQSLINLTDYFTTPTKDVWKSLRVGETKSKDEAIYVLTPTDLNKLIQKIDFWKYQQQLLSQVPYQMWEFEFDEKLEKDVPILEYSHFKNEAEIQRYLNEITGKKSIPPQNMKFNIANHMFQNQDRPQTLQAYLYYINKQYKINEKTKQIPICIFTAQYNIFKKNQYRQYFESIERLNYSNYHIIYVDDKSTDGSAEKMYDLVNNGNYKRMKNRMKIFQNQQQVGALGNLLFYTLNYCKQDQIVVNIDADDAILGRQALKIVNSVYGDENIWYAYSKYLDYNPGGYISNIGFSSQQMNIPTTKYRRHRIYLTSHLRTFRQKLMKAVPLYQLIDFHYNTTTRIAWPTFQSLAYDTSQVHAHLELSGNERMKYMPDFLYSYYGSAGTRKCYNYHERFDELKNSVKIPLQKLNSLDQKGHQINDTAVEQSLYDFPNQLNNILIDQQCYLP